MARAAAASHLHALPARAEAVAFYERLGFAAVPERPHRLFQKMSDIEAAYFAD